MKSPIRGVRAIELNCIDVNRAAEFYVKVWNLSEVVRVNDAAFLRGTAPFHSILVLYPSSETCIRRIVFDVQDVAAVNALYEGLGSKYVLTVPAKLTRPGAGFGFTARDDAGRQYLFVTSVEDFEPQLDTKDKPRKIVHININATDLEGTVGFFKDKLGFSVIDQSGPLWFLHCDNSDHASIVVCTASQDTVNHIAFELPDLESVMRGAGRMRDAGYPIEWGVGRHGAGNNVFAYFAGPEEIPLEYTAEVTQVTDDYIPHGPDYWKFPPGRMDQWGITDPRSSRWRRIQNMHPFTKAKLAD
jgi:catechol 2,3-dioxygenase-like lactoylglutathione lyase family enzyme